MILSASRRTDLPRFHAAAFNDALRRGYIDVGNPFNAAQVSRVSLVRQDVDCIVFWTRYPAPFLDTLRFLEDSGWNSAMFVTLTGYPRILEPGAPPFEEAVDAIRRASQLLGPERLWLRFDPVILSSVTPAESVASLFKAALTALEGYSSRVVVSLYDEYAASRRRLLRAGIAVEEFDPLNAAHGDLLRSMAAEAALRGMEISACAEPRDLRPFGISAAPCIDVERVNRLFNLQLLAGKDGGQRKACACATSKDIGSYHSCPAGCLYCYAGDYRPSSPRP